MSGRARIRNYKIGDLLGEGTFGVVKSAVHTKTGAIVVSAPPLILPTLPARAPSALRGCAPLIQPALREHRPRRAALAWWGAAL